MRIKTLGTFIRGPMGSWLKGRVSSTAYPSLHLSVFLAVTQPSVDYSICHLLPFRLRVSVIKAVIMLSQWAPELASRGPIGQAPPCSLADHIMPTAAHSIVGAQIPSP